MTVDGPAGTSNTRWIGGTRRLTPEHRSRLVTVTAVLFVALGVLTLVLAVWSKDPRHPLALGIIGAGVVLVGCGVACLHWVPDSTFDRFQAPLFYTLIFGTAPLISFGVASAGPTFGPGTIAYVLSPIFAFYLLKRTLAWLVIVTLAIDFGLVVLLQDGWANPLVVWLFFVGSVAAGAAVIGSLMGRYDELATSEQEARVALATANEQLQSKVDQQVDELQRLSGLRRFLSPQVADVLLSSPSVGLLTPHRQEIAVFFCDLRGWTTFSLNEAPEDVLRVLDDYYAIVCKVLDAHNATIGTFNGDGVMAFLNDPLLCDDPAGTAVRLPAGLRHRDRPRLREHRSHRWRAAQRLHGCGACRKPRFAPVR